MKRTNVWENWGYSDILKLPTHYWQKQFDFYRNWASTSNYYKHQTIMWPVLSNHEFERNDV